MKMFKRGDNGVEAIINGFSFPVNDVPFWKSFNSSWEIDTKNLYSKFVVPNKSVIDVGAWIGPTVFIGYAHNAKHIYAIEADPANAYILKKNCRKSHIEDKVTIINKCIYPTSGEIISFGDSINSGDTSTASLGGSRKVVSSTLDDIIAENRIDLDEVSLIKIDIEGSELLLVKDLLKISSHIGFTILLSLHQTFWHRIPGDPEALKQLCQAYDFFTSDEHPILAENFDEYINSNIHCLVILKPKNTAYV